MQDHSPLAPEERRKQLASMSAAFGRDVAEKLRPHEYPLEVIKRVAVGVYNDGFIHAGNLAYLGLLALFPFFIFAAAFAQLLGQSESGRMTVATVLAQLPPNVAEVLQAPIAEVLNARTGALLWIGAIIGLWTVGSFIETIRDILRRAYGVKYCAPFWHYRLASMAVIVGAVFLLLFAFALSVVLSSVAAGGRSMDPRRSGSLDAFTLYRVIPAIALYGTVYFIFYLLTPLRYRRHGCIEMAWRAADHGLVAGDGGAVAGGDRTARRLRPDLRQPRRSDDRPDFLLHGRARRGYGRGAQRGAGGSFADGAKGRNLFGSVQGPA